MRHSRPLTALTLALVAGSAGAQTPDAAACLEIASPTERLACYDAAHGYSARTKVAAPPAAAAVASPTAAVAEPDPDDFGFTKSKADNEGESLSSPIREISKDAYKRLVFELDNGQVWRQIEYKRLQVDDGDVAVIRHGSFGSYKLYVGDTKRWTRVRRVR